MIRILSAIDKYWEEFPPRGKENALRLRALVLLARYTGMRIGDAVRLTAGRIKGNRLFLYTQKTDVPVRAFDEVGRGTVDIGRGGRSNLRVRRASAASMLADNPNLMSQPGSVVGRLAAISESAPGLCDREGVKPTNMLTIASLI